MSMVDQLANTEIADLMHGSPVSVPSSENLGNVVDTMKDRFGAMLVVDDGKLTGIFTERDVMDRVDLAGDWRQIPVGEVMTRQPKTLKPSSTLSETISMMSKGRFRHVPVVDGDELVGIVSIRDVMTHAVERFPKDFLNLPPGPNSEASGPWGG